MIDLNGPKKLNLMSMDITEEQKAKLKQIFPHIFNEDKIDFDKLRLTLGEAVDEGRERYGMTWAGKSECFKIIQQPSIGTLKPCREESVNFDDTENLFIEGDNLEVLKILQKSYGGKIKMIYIDPPYNSGNDFIYPDNYSESLDTYLTYTKQVNDEGIKFSTNTEKDGRFHSKWLSMIYSRLFMARNLLQDDGVIFISIDDDEMPNLRKVCDEIFRQENFVAQFVWQKKYSRDNRPLIGTTHEYIFMYAKEISNFSEVRNLLPPSKKSLLVYKNPNNDPRGRWRPIPMTAQAGHATANQFYWITAPSGAEHYPPTGRCWSVTKDKFEELLKEGRIYFGKNGSSQPNLIRYMDEIEGFVPWTWLPAKEVGHTDSAMKEFYEVLGKEAVFETLKPTSLLKYFLKLASSKEDSEILEKEVEFETLKPTSLLKHFLEIASNKEEIILDFFSGTSSTAHAVLDLNREDDGNRKFIMVQLPEPCGKETEAFKSGYKNIADIGKERIRRVIKKIKDEYKQSSSQTTLFDTDSNDNIKQLDLGLKVFKLDKSNFNLWDGSIEVNTTGDKIIKQIQLAIENVDINSSEEDILYELLLKSGFTLTSRIKEIELAGKKVYSIEEGALLICLNRELSKEVITEMARREPKRVICLDDGFLGNDQLKTNAVQIMKSFGIEDFRTV